MLPPADVQIPCQYHGPFQIFKNHGLQLNLVLMIQVMKTPPVTYFIKQAASIKSGSQRPGHAVAAEISVRNIFDIAQEKQQDAPDMSLESICRSVAGTCKSMGVRVVSQ